MRGRVLPLLAVATSFHPDLTGRENITLFATSVGIPRRTIVDRIDDVIDFAEISEHIDTPVKRYSSGMVSRLGVAIAMQYPADIYIFDEVLAVVDAAFRERCIIAIQTLTERGATVIFVSHQSEQIASVCSRVAWFEKGMIREVGPVDRTLANYDAALGS